MTDEKGRTLRKMPAGDIDEAAEFLAIQRSFESPAGDIDEMMEFLSKPQLPQVEKSESKISGATLFNQGLDLFRLGQYKQAIPIFEKAARARNYAPAFVYLELMNLLGLGGKKDPEKVDLYAGKCREALSWFEDNRATDYPLRQYYLGLMYRHGIGVEIDLEKAFQLFKEAAQQKNMDAEYALGFCYMRGEDIDKNRERGFAHYEKAAEQGYPPAQLGLAICYDRGMGVAASVPTAKLWSRRAADQGHILSYFNLAFYYLNNKPQKALRLLTLAAQQEDPMAQTLLGQCHIDELGVSKDLQEAVQWQRHSLAAEQGEMNAQRALGDCYRDGRGVERDKELAAHWHRLAAEQLKNTGARIKQSEILREIISEDSRSIYAVHDFSRSTKTETKKRQIKEPKLSALDTRQHDAESLLIPESKISGAKIFNPGLDLFRLGQYKQALAIFEKAAHERNYVPAFVYLELMNLLGLGGKKDPAKVGLYGKECREAISWFEDSRAKDYPFRQCCLGMMHRYGIGVEKNIEIALQYFRKAAQLKNMDAEVALGTWYVDDDENTDKNEKWGFSHLENAAKQGHPTAQMKLGKCYDFGRGVTVSTPTAKSLYTQAADQGHLQAYVYLALQCLHNKPQEAIRLLKLAAQQEDPEAQALLGTCYRKGDGVTKNLLEAERWYILAATQRDWDARAQNLLGALYEVTQNLTEAVKWYDSAAAQGCAQAQFNLGLCFDKGIGVSKNAQQAFYWFSLAAQQGLSAAQFCVASCYDDGEGVTKDMQLAVHWYLRAAKQGHKNAQFNLACSYKAGAGVPVNLDEATYWFKKAAEQGDAEAEKELEMVQRSIAKTRPVVAEAISEVGLFSQREIAAASHSVPNLPVIRQYYTQSI